ncbi:MAG: NAD-dependent epimerase/dehydratase family protein [Candidatus Aenigmarchaeota archaeon]|nr:NAD-dependent epimerase/dehydratase family protein [Candidatus Aenigmarchaeota archaeon]
MQMLVTGAAGFMGSWLVDTLVAQGHDVIGVDNLSGGYVRNINPKSRFILGDLRDPKVCELATKGADVVYHLAAYAAEGQSVFSFDMINDINISSTNRLLTAAVNNNVKKVVFTSSMAVYGDAPTPMHEDLPRAPVDPYGWGKAYGEGLLESCNKAFGLDYTIIRPHNVYGPRQNMADFSRNVVAIFINRVMKGMPPLIYGDGEQTRAFSYIADVAPAIAHAGLVDKTNSHIINVGSEEVTSVKSLAHLVLKTFGSAIEPTHHPERPNEVKHAHCTTAKSEKLLGYKTNHPLIIGVANMVEWAKRLGPKSVKYGLPIQITKNAPPAWLNRVL